MWWFVAGIKDASAFSGLGRQAFRQSGPRPTLNDGSSKMPINTGTREYDRLLTTMCASNGDRERTVRMYCVTVRMLFGLARLAYEGAKKKYVPNS